MHSLPRIFSHSLLPATFRRLVEREMTANAFESGSSINGLRTLELGSALLWLREQLQQKLGPGVHSIALSGPRTSKEQEILGVSQILQAMFPFAIELALKSLWDCFHEPGTHDRRHDLDVLFQSIDRGATDVSSARSAQKQARDLWLEFQTENRIHCRGTLDAFLSAHARDFVETRYYTPKPRQYLQMEDFAFCLYCIVFPLAAREPQTFSNLLSRIIPTDHHPGPER